MQTQESKLGILELHNSPVDCLTWYILFEASFRLPKAPWFILSTHGHFCCCCRSTSLPSWDLTHDADESLSIYSIYSREWPSMSLSQKTICFSRFICFYIIQLKLGKMNDIFNKTFYIYSYIYIYIFVIVMHNKKS